MCQGEIDSGGDWDATGAAVLYLAKAAASEFYQIRDAPRICVYFGEDFWFSKRN